MGTIEQIDDLHARLGSAKTLPEYVRALMTLGVERYDSYLADGHSEYFGRGGHRVVSPPMHEVLPVAQTGQRESCLLRLRVASSLSRTCMKKKRDLIHIQMTRVGTSTKAYRATRGK